MKQLLLIIALIAPSTTLAKEKRISKQTASAVVLFCPFCIVEVAKRMEEPKEIKQEPIQRTLASQQIKK